MAVVEHLTRLARQGERAMRLRRLLLAPRREWALIAAEPADPLSLYRKVILPLAAIAPLAKLFAWSLVFGYLPFGVALRAGLMGYVLSLGAVFLLAKVAARLAPHFHAEDHADQALKLVAYAAIPGWLGGIFHLLPVLGVLSIAASLYSIVLLAVGAPVLLAVPPERLLSYTTAVVVAALCLMALIGAAVAALFGIAALGMA